MRLLRRNSDPVIATLPWPIYRDISLGGYRIRKDTMILVPVTAVHYNEELYPEPEKFRPERFLDTKPDRYGFIPFGAGAHRCPGSTFYLTEASILLHRIFGRLDLEPCDPGVDEARFVFGSVSRPKGDTRVIVPNRRSAAEVPWYQPSPGEQLTPLKEALLPPQPGSDSPSRCPFSGTQESM
ncbi:cytochrome P450 [Mycobacteroides franklinii]|uniref:Putative cytochrome P450 120 n=1 Tax=Mycobacteroides franklinii TaxID=948102 RepID=A0A4R8QZK3_9MYCO|nr:cytochrome P450 [Mycobacteroides franklinii]TDZ45772.1 putative cytochrome P450 120 [Mycobacteroides franklinii]TDZ49262.1 putative cytochrome P450 120 [Mycobacteroides franklinii]TDZ59442.1 putative cytochrome P450 120 [Mycobacteroides franklinii]TDZ66957.1 putative cytochrome P450 120 [Mycobacteroides franklinii]TDZ72881.1 putative cytochrome P450 120 [Mycobacteroides franklinii]